MTTVLIDPATPTDLPALLALLTASGLPHAGLAEHLATGLVARTTDALVGSAALELYGPSALLRSVAVAPALRGQGLGQRLTSAALALARAYGVRQIYLLTTTAEGYFPRFGFTPIARATVDPAVQASVEFTSACPANARVLTLALEA
jgi:amino-acid N-acetyltransferase